MRQQPPKEPKNGAPVQPRSSCKSRSVPKRPPTKKERVPEIARRLGLSFGEPKRVNTRRGERLLRKSDATDAFWREWKENKSKLEAVGLSVAPGCDRWVVLWWAKLLRHNGNESHSIILNHAEIDPSGLLPYQIEPAKQLLAAVLAHRFALDASDILIDARQASNNPLQLVVDDQYGDRIVTLELPLSIGSVTNMFRRQNDRHHYPMITAPSDNFAPQMGPPTNYPDQFTNGNYLVAVHGYNVNASEASGFAAEMFKRFWWSGSRARFVAYFWRGDESQEVHTNPPATPDFQINVVNALLTGGYLRSILNSLAVANPQNSQPSIVLFAHSLGNMVCARALTLPGPPLTAVTHYYMVDAAIPAEAISADERTAESLSLMPNADWAGFPPRLWASNWYQVFSGDGFADSRSQLTWLNLFGSLPSVTNVTNFYSSDDQVLQIPTTNVTPSIPDIIFLNGVLSWVAQEKLKGTNDLERIARLPFVSIRDIHGGWGFNMGAWTKSLPRTQNGPAGTYPNVDAINLTASDVTEDSVPTLALAGVPFFRKFQATDIRYNDANGGHYDGAALLKVRGDADGSAQGDYFPTKAKLLGEAIPALSYAVGSHTVAALETGGDRHNLDLSPSLITFGFESGWPASREGNTAWLHGDSLDVAYTYVYPLYDKIVTSGGLK